VILVKDVVPRVENIKISHSANILVADGAAIQK
jgi:hypothetical protein